MNFLQTTLQFFVFFFADVVFQDVRVCNSETNRCTECGRIQATYGETSGSVTCPNGGAEGNQVQVTMSSGQVVICEIIVYGHLLGK